MIKLNSKEMWREGCLGRYYDIIICSRPPPLLFGAERKNPASLLGPATAHDHGRYEPRRAPDDEK